MDGIGFLKLDAPLQAGYRDGCGAEPHPWPELITDTSRLMLPVQDERPMLRSVVRCLNAMVLVKPATVVHSHSHGSPYDSGFLVGSLDCRRPQVAKFPVFFLRNGQQSASKKEGL